MDLDWSYWEKVLINNINRSFVYLIFRKEVFLEKFNFDFDSGTRIEFFLKMVG